MVFPLVCQYMLLASCSVCCHPRYLSANLSLATYLLFCACVLLYYRCSAQHTPSLNFMSLLTTLCSHLSRFLCKACETSKYSTTSLSLIPSANLLRMHSTPCSRQLIKSLNSTHLRVESWGTALMTSCQTHIAPFTTKF